MAIKSEIEMIAMMIAILVMEKIPIIIIAVDLTLLSIHILQQQLNCISNLTRSERKEDYDERRKKRGKK